MNVERRTLLKGALLLPLARYLSLSTRDETPEGFVNVKDFGAVGDGFTDDTPAINRAMKAGSHLFFPAGTYVLGSTIHMEDRHLRYTDELFTAPADVHGIRITNCYVEREVAA